MENKKVKSDNNVPLQKKEEVKTEVIPTSSEVLPKSNRKYLVFVGVMIVAIIVIVLFTLNRSPNKQKDVVAATVNGETITVDQLDRYYNGLPAQYKLTATKGTILNQLIEREVLYQEAEKEGVGVSDSEAQNIVMLAKTSSGLTPEQFSQKLAEQNMTEEELVLEYKKQMTINNFLNNTLLSNIVISDEDAKKYYNENKAKFKVGEQVTVRHILIGDKDLDSAGQEEKAKSLLKEINKDNFCDYVKNYSSDTASIDKCGEYTFGKDDALVEEFKNLSLSQNPGDIGIVKTQFGQHIIWTVKKSPPKTLVLKDVKDQIKTSLRTQKLQLEYPKFYESLKKNAVINIKYIDNSAPANAPIVQQQ